MNKDVNFSIMAGVIAVLVGLIAFTYNWVIIGGGWQYFGVFLFPGNLVLSIFSEEIDFWPKFALQMSGQFLVTFFMAYLLRKGLHIHLRYLYTLVSKKE